MGWKALFWCPCHLAGKSEELFFEKLTEMMGEAILLQMASQMQNASGAAAPWAEEKEKGQEKGQEKGKEEGQGEGEGRRRRRHRRRSQCH